MQYGGGLGFVFAFGDFVGKHGADNPNFAYCHIHVFSFKACVVPIGLGVVVPVGKTGAFAVSLDKVYTVGNDLFLLFAACAIFL